MSEKVGLEAVERRGRNKICTYDLGDSGAFTETNVDHCKPRRRLAEPGEECLELLGCAYIVVKQQFKEAPLIVVNGDPEREPTEDLKVLVGKVIRDRLCQRLGSLTSSRLSLYN